MTLKKKRKKEQSILVITRDDDRRRLALELDLRAKHLSLVAEVGDKC